MADCRCAGAAIKQMRLPKIPPLAGQVLAIVPLPALEGSLQRVARSFGRRHPAVFTRLGAHASKTYVIDPTDLPFVFRLRPWRPAPWIEAVLGPARQPWDARIAGSLAALLGMVHGTLDGDALFFSRDLVVEGDTEAVLALRNALDDAEVDLLAEAAVTLGAAGRWLEPFARGLLREASRLTGVAFTRSEP